MALQYWLLLVRNALRSQKMYLNFVIYALHILKYKPSTCIFTCFYRILGILFRDFSQENLGAKLNVK